MNKLLKPEIIQEISLETGIETIQSLGIDERLEKALKILTKDALYRKEYEQFVTNMSNADDQDRIHFDGAHAALERIAGYL